MNKWLTEIWTPRLLTNEELLLLADLLILLGINNHVITSVAPVNSVPPRPEAVHVPGNNTVN